MADKKKNPAKIKKPFLKGSPTDENTVKQAFKFFGLLAIVGFMCFIVCSMTSFDSPVLRTGINLLIIVLILIVFYNRGLQNGTDAVARGEILYQHIEKGQDVTSNEKRIPYHPLKGFCTGLLGSSLLILLAMILAFTAQKQLTGAGTLPSWTDSYMRRDEIGPALISYTHTDPVSFADIIRIMIRMMIMPFISMAGTENKSLLLLAEKMSPLILMLPAFAYGIGYLRGPNTREMIHSEIAENRRKRISKEKRARKKRSNTVPKGPEQLN